MFENSVGNNHSINLANETNFYGGATSGSSSSASDAQLTYILNILHSANNNVNRIFEPGSTSSGVGRILKQYDDFVSSLSDSHMCYMESPYRLTLSKWYDIEGDTYELLNQLQQLSVSIVTRIQAIYRALMNHNSSIDTDRYPILQRIPVSDVSTQSIGLQNINPGTEIPTANINPPESNPTQDVPSKGGSGDGSEPGTPTTPNNGGNGDDVTTPNGGGSGGSSTVTNPDNNSGGGDQQDGTTTTTTITDGDDVNLGGGDTDIPTDGLFDDPTMPNYPDDSDYLGPAAAAGGLAGGGLFDYDPDSGVGDYGDWSYSDPSDIGSLFDDDPYENLRDSLEDYYRTDPSYEPYNPYYPNDSDDYYRNYPSYEPYNPSDSDDYGNRTNPGTDSGNSSGSGSYWDDWNNRHPSTPGTSGNGYEYPNGGSNGNNGSNGTNGSDGNNGTGSQGTGGTGGGTGSGTPNANSDNNGLNGNPNGGSNGTGGNGLGGTTGGTGVNPDDGSDSSKLKPGQTGGTSDWGGDGSTGNGGTNGGYFTGSDNGDTNGNKKGNLRGLPDVTVENVGLGSVTLAGAAGAGSAAAGMAGNGSGYTNSYVGTLGGGTGTGANGSMGFAGTDEEEKRKKAKYQFTTEEGEIENPDEQKQAKDIESVVVDTLEPTGVESLDEGANMGTILGFGGISAGLGIGGAYLSQAKKEAEEEEKKKQEKKNEETLGLVGGIIGASFISDDDDEDNKKKKKRNYFNNDINKPDDINNFMKR